MLDLPEASLDPHKYDHLRLLCVSFSAFFSREKEKPFHPTDVHFNSIAFHSLLLTTVYNFQYLQYRSKFSSAVFLELGSRKRRASGLFFRPAVARHRPRNRAHIPFHPLLLHRDGLQAYSFVQQWHATDPAVARHRPRNRAHIPFQHLLHSRLTFSIDLATVGNNRTRVLLMTWHTEHTQIVCRNSLKTAFNKLSVQ
jgi:hypothetical protein